MRDMLHRVANPTAHLYGPPSPPRLVLVLDSEPSIRLSLGRMLRLKCFVPVEAATTAEAVRVTMANAVEAVVMDLGRPGADSGLAFLAWFRAQPHHGTSPIVALTGELYLTPNQVALIEQFEAMLFYKPVSFATLERCLTDLFMRESATRQGSVVEPHR